MPTLGLPLCSTLALYHCNIGAIALWGK
uniref:Uncharacterized protein n=1 Tax=Arundo donax TaxID=35708 RepID=A0A0A9FS92_ARUDO